MLLKAGVKLGSLMPDGSKAKISSHLGDKGINIYHPINKRLSKDVEGAVIEKFKDVMKKE